MKFAFLLFPVGYLVWLQQAVADTGILLFPVTRHEVVGGGSSWQPDGNAADEGKNSNL